MFIWVIAMGLVGVLVGAILLSLWTLLFYALFARRAMGDGQFGMLFMWVLPLGGMLGFVSGLTLALLHIGERHAAGWICSIGGAVTAGLCTIVAVGISLLQSQTDSRFSVFVVNLLVNLLSPFEGIPFPWAIFLIGCGWGILGKR